MSENDFFLKIASLLSDPTSVIIVMLLQTCQGDIIPEFFQSTGHPPIERTFFCSLHVSVQRLRGSRIVSQSVSEYSVGGKDC
jgi:hypothetical protein